MLDHISLRVTDYQRSKQFYQAILALLGYTLAMEGSSGAGFSKGRIPGFWIKQGDSGEKRAMVDAFHRAALAVGYYGAFVLDPDGYNVEAVCHGLK